MAMKRGKWLLMVVGIGALALTLVSGVGCGRSAAGAAAAASPGTFEWFVGDWENTQTSQAFWKIVVRSDRVMEQWVRKNAPSRAAALDVKKIWVDSEAATCCQFLAEDECFGKVIGLMRVDGTGKVLEYNYKKDRPNQAWPEKIDSRSPSGDWTVYLAYGRK